MNRYREHVYVIPEDDANRQIAEGFVVSPYMPIAIMPVAGGWLKVLQTFQDEYISVLRRYKSSHVVLLIDFDDQVEKRRYDFEQVIPIEHRSRVFVVGCRNEPESLKQATSFSYKKIGEQLAIDCENDSFDHWNHEQLQHNDAERQRLVQTVKPFLFKQS